MRGIPLVVLLLSSTTGLLAQEAERWRDWPSPARIAELTTRVTTVEMGAGHDVVIGFPGFRLGEVEVLLATVTLGPPVRVDLHTQRGLHLEHRFEARCLRERAEASVVGSFVPLVRSVGERGPVNWSAGFDRRAVAAAVQLRYGEQLLTLIPPQGGKRAEAADGVVAWSYVSAWSRWKELQVGVLVLRGTDAPDQPHGRWGVTMSGDVVRKVWPRCHLAVAVPGLEPRHATRRSVDMRRGSRTDEYLFATDDEWPADGYVVRLLIEDQVLRFYFKL